MQIVRINYEPPKIIMSTSFIMSLIMTLLVFQCTQYRSHTHARHMCAVYWGED